ncbi:hypothetical protein BDK51DRAFT_50622 [Blyttiomyces helicus]|uniref:Uncharacterized protein n=1 Tax=Blyttiomyces helicus TaxID=388810 RepID=A0A4P9VTE1_9FUNG|nr:hypothetical protein BDK51DRAFT_50622 [Blyttiomyces helicus]|eukprot:RKO82779.1 hypothetical protein BDK51DRAFT_50622 [Blyttiomyces helicus]
MRTVWWDYGWPILYGQCALLAYMNREAFVSDGARMFLVAAYLIASVASEMRYTQEEVDALLAKKDEVIQKKDKVIKEKVAEIQGLRAQIRLIHNLTNESFYG